MPALNPTKTEQQTYFLNNLANININYLVDPTAIFKSGDKKAERIKEKVACKFLKQASKMNKVLADEAVIDFIGEWKIIWGPFISFSNAEAYFGKKGRAWATDNTVYLAELVNRPNTPDSDQLPDYYIGVAGTNPASPYGWFTEDLNVKEVEAWPPKYLNLQNEIKDAGSIAKGTWLGISRIWHMGSHTAPPHVAKEDLKVGYAPIEDGTQSLWEYIHDHISGDKTIMVGGHSLGGALSPTLATALADKIADSAKASLSNVKIAAFPTAGPTPGDEIFADHQAAVLSHYKAIFNEEDIVPQAWEKSTLSKVSNFYKDCGFEGFPLVQNNLLINRFVEWAEAQPAIVFKRTPSSPKSNFVVKTWDNSCIDVKNEKTKKGKSYEQLLSKAIGPLSKVVADLYMDKLSTFAGQDLDNTEGKLLIKQFLAFLAYAGLQHTVAYTSETGHGFQLDKKAFGVYQDNLKKTEDMVAQIRDGKNAFGYLFGELADHFSNED